MTQPKPWNAHTRRSSWVSLGVQRARGSGVLLNVPWSHLKAIATACRPNKKFSCVGEKHEAYLIYIKELCPSVRRSFPCQTAVLSQPGYWVSLSVRDIPQCHGYHLVFGLFVRKTGSLGVMGELLGGFWELRVSVSLSVMGITQCHGYPLGCVRNGYHSV